MSSSSDTLDTFSVRLLEFEDAWSGRTGAKFSAIRAEFDISPARYYQMLDAVLSSPLALRHNPILVHRLCRMRDARVLARVAHTFRTESQETH